MKKPLVGLVLLFAFLLLSTAAHADDYTITIRETQFAPKELIIPQPQCAMSG